MKTMKRIALKTGLVIGLVFLLPSCLDIFFTTEVHPNGSITKTIVCEGDSSEIIDLKLPAIGNESWEHEWSYTHDDKDRLTLSKTFQSARKAAQDLNPADTVPVIRIQPELKKRFRWFFTYMNYQDILLSTNPFQKVDWRDYLSEEAVRLIPMDEEEREADPNYVEENYEGFEEDFERYVVTSGFEDIYQLFILALDQSESSALKKNLVANKKQLILKQLQIDDADISDTDDVLEAFRAVLGRENVDLIYRQNRELFAHFDAKLAYFDQSMDDNYRFAITMPGLLINTNSNIIEGNRLSWEVDFFDAYFEDFSMQAESRIVNIWAFIVTGIALGFLLFALFYKLFKKKTT